MVYHKFQKYITTVFFTETLRKYPVVPFLDRACAKDWKFPDSSGQSNVTLPRGTATYIPVYGIHHDPQYYPDPDRFDPERFTQENMKERHQFTYLPFGGGPRICLGEFQERTPRIFRSEFYHHERWKILQAFHGYITSEHFWYAQLLYPFTYCYLAWNRPLFRKPKLFISLSVTGMRFALMQMKTGMVHILSHFELAPCKDTPVPLKLHPKPFLMQPLGEITLTLKKRIRTETKTVQA